MSKGNLCGLAGLVLLDKQIGKEQTFGNPREYLTLQLPNTLQAREAGHPPSIFRDDKQGGNNMKPKLLSITLGGIVLILTGSAMAASVNHQPIIPSLPANPTFVVSTVPTNGDQNPYGVAFVPKSFVAGGSLNPGDIIVSNFNNSAIVQGTGTTIIRVTPTAQASVFFQGSLGLGLTTALGVLSAGFVLVGDVPTIGGVAQQGALLVIDRFGNQVITLTDPVLLDGPWDLTIHDEGDQAEVFVANVLSGTVTRLDFQIPTGGNPIVLSETQIASGYSHRLDPAALVVGPTGLAYDPDKDVLYVVSTDDNEIFAIPSARKRATDAGMGNLIYQDNVHLHGPLGLALAPNGDLLTSNGDAVNPDPTHPNEIVEFTATGQFVAEVPVDTSGIPGGAFGIALAKFGNKIRFAAVDDNFNNLEVWVVP
jgi:hypothetical protein